MTADLRIVADSDEQTRGEPTRGEQPRTGSIRTDEKHLTGAGDLGVVPDRRSDQGDAGSGHSQTPRSPVPPLSAADCDWSTRAVCATQDPDILFVTGAAQRDAARMCRGCPVKLECLADALDNRVEFGVWGGLTERQRRALLKRCPEVTSWRSMLEEARAEATRQVAG